MTGSSRPGLVFISYKREEADKAEPLREALADEGFTVFWDEDLQCGEAWAEELDQAVQDAACIIVLWSERSAASQWVRHEASQAIARKVYAPCRIELVQLESPYDRIQATDLIDWDGDRQGAGFRNLLERVDALVPAPVSLPRRIGRWLRSELATLVASGVALLALLLLVTIFRAQQADRREKVYDCSASRELRAELAIEMYSKGQNLRRVCLSAANLSRAKLIGADLLKANLSEASLWEADLSEANLSGADLRGANLIGADLFEANLSGADLSGANLFEANLIGADLSGADLSEADLRAHLIRAELREADLSEATLWGADLTKAKLRDANLTGADLWLADLGGADLLGANLTEANLTGVNLTEVLYLYGACANAVPIGWPAYLPSPRSCLELVAEPDD